MARRSRHFTQHSSAEINRMFNDAIGGLGMRMARPGREEMIDAVFVDGAPFGDRPRELRKPGSAFYATSYVEARATAAMLVDLGLDGEVQNVVRRDSPDVDVCFRDSSHLYVEQAMVMDEDAHRFSVAIDDANILAEELSATDPIAKAVFSSGLLTIRVDDELSTERVRAPLSSVVLANEIIGVSSTLTGRVDLLEPDAARFPLLDALNARIFYHPSDNMRTGRPIMLPAFHGDRAILRGRLIQRVEDKVRKSSAYDPSLAPLWLLLTVDKHFDAGVHFSNAYEAAVRTVEWGSFDRVVVQCSDGVSLAFDPQASRETLPLKEVEI